jgi:hypothetical protein
VRRKKHPAIDSNKAAMPAATDTRVLPRRQFPPYTFRSRLFPLLFAYFRLPENFI